MYNGTAIIVTNKNTIIIIMIAVCERVPVAFVGIIASRRVRTITRARPVADFPFTRGSALRLACLL